MNQRTDMPLPSAAESLELLGLFPAFHTRNAGGIQVSGELAWEALVTACSARGRRAHALQVDLSQSVLGDTEPHSTITQTRFNAALQVFRARWAPASVLCWHADLIPLIPLIRSSERRILFLHGIEAWQQPGWVKQRLFAGLDLLLANSEYTLARAREAAPILRRVRAEIVPLGIGEPVGSSLPEPDAAPAAIMIGRLERSERYKGHEAVLDAWPAVLKRRPDARLWMVGDGDLRMELEARARQLDLAEHVVFFGRVDERRKEELLGRARCLLLPSRAEGFGLVYAEAMRVGRPSLVGSEDAGREVVNPPECGLSASADRADSLVESIGRLLTPGAEWDAWSRNALRRHAERYTAAAFQERLVRTLWRDQ
ncbi:MAG: glycosyltransferase family 4 protein [Longimicrobiales bacterium]